MRYLVTGGLGVIGSIFARRMLDDGHEVVIIDSCDEPRNDWMARLLRAPMADGSPAKVTIWRRRLEEANLDELEKCDAVLHAAASTGIPYSVTAPDDDWQRNVEATRRLLDALRVYPRPTVVLSSIKPYRVPPATEIGNGLDESTVLEPDEPYAASKAAQSMLCMAYARSYDLPVVTFRCSNLYGPAPCHGPRHGWLTWFCISAAIGRSIEVQGSGEQSRDMLHAEDVTRAALSVFTNFREQKLAGEVFNLGGGSGNLISVLQAASILHDLTGVVYFPGPARAMDDDRVFVNTGKLRKATGWFPMVSVVDGIKSTLVWAQQNRDELRALYVNL